MLGIKGPASEQWCHQVPTYEISPPHLKQLKSHISPLRISLWHKHCLLTIIRGKATSIQESISEAFIITRRN